MSLLMSVMFISSTSLPAQSYNTSSSKAIKYFEKARQEFLCKNYDEALLNVDKALQKDDEFADAYLLKAELYLELNDDSLAMESYENVFKIDSMSFPKSSIVLSKLYSEYLQFDKSIRLLEWYLSLDGQSDKLRKLAEQQLHLAYFRKSLVENPVDYSPRNIGSDVNTTGDEYVNQYHVNKNKIIFTKRYKTENEYYLEENVFVATQCDSHG